MRGADSERWGAALRVCLLLVRAWFERVSGVGAVALRLEDTDVGALRWRLHHCWLLLGCKRCSYVLGASVRRRCGWPVPACDVACVLCKLSDILRHAGPSGLR